MNTSRMFGAYGNHPVYMGDAALYNENLETMNRLGLGNISYKIFTWEKTNDFSIIMVMLSDYWFNRKLIDIDYGC